MTLRFRAASCFPMVGKGVPFLKADKSCKSDSIINRDCRLKSLLLLGAETVLEALLESRGLIPISFDTEENPRITVWSEGIGGALEFPDQLYILLAVAEHGGWLLRDFAPAEQTSPDFRILGLGERDRFGIAFSSRVLDGERSEALQ